MLEIKVWILRLSSDKLRVTNLGEFVYFLVSKSDYIFFLLTQNTHPLNPPPQGRGTFGLPLAREGEIMVSLVLGNKTRNDEQKQKIHKTKG